MIQFACDSCHRVKGDKETWILGYAAESMGLTAAQREITILPRWDAERALHALAVHFCSERCKNQYRVRLFGEQAAPRSRRRTIASVRSHAKRTNRNRSEARGSRRRKRAA